MEQLNSILVEMSKQFNVAVEHLYGVLIRQSKIEGIVYLVYVLGFVALTVIAVKYVRWLYIIEDEDGRTGWRKACNNDTDCAHIVIQVVGGTLWVIGVCCALFWIGNVLTALLNPEFYAIRRILNMLP